MNHCYLLLHGAWHGSWCWQPLAQKLQAAGHHVIAPDLPGRAGVPAAQSYDDYINVVGNLLQSQTQPVILVGHSISGLLISQVASLYPQKVKQLIYLAAYLFNSGENANDIIKSMPYRSELGKYVQEDQLTHTMRVSHKASTLFYNHCSKAKQQWAIQQLVEESLFVREHKLQINDAAFAPIPKHYILATDDLIVPDALQTWMIARHNYPVTGTQINSDHSPFLSHVDELLSVLKTITRP